jgi:lipopolysaccharide export system permease protein
MHSRAALAASCLFFILVGGPYAILKAKGQLLTSFMYTFGPIIVAYYPLTLGIMTQAKEGRIDPSWAMWTGNAAMLAWGITALRQVLKH